MLVLVFLGSFVALEVEPVIAWSQRHRWRCGPAVAAVVLALLLVLGAAILLVLLPAVGQVGGFVGHIPSAIAGVGANLGGQEEFRAT